MNETTLIITGMICATVLLAVLIIVIGRIRTQKQDLLKQLVDEDKIDQEKISSLVITNERYNRDFRRGTLLIGLGFTLGLFFYFMGGILWKMAIVPIVVGFIYLWFWYLNDKSARG